MFKRHFIKELSSYLDNQLAEKEKLKVEVHLKDCEFCQKELSRLRLLSEKLKAWQVPGPGPFFADAVKEEIAHQGSERGAVKMKTKKWYIVVPSGVLAGILVFAFLQVYVRRGLQGRIRGSADHMGEQFDPSNGYETGWQTQGAGRTVTRRSRNADTGATALGGESLVTSNEYDQHGVGLYGGALSGAGAELKAYKKYKNNLAIAKRDGAQYEPYYLKGGAYGMTSPTREGGIHDESGGRREVAVLGGYTGEEIRVNAFNPTSLTQFSSPEGGPVIIVQPVLPATGIGDKIIRTAEVRLEVEDASQAYTKVSAICQELGGYLASSNFRKDHEGRQAGTITMRIPKDKFLDALNKINALGKVENSSTQSQDVSQDYANLKNQLETTMIIYNKMMEALQKRQVTIPEAMRLENELTPILRRVEHLKNKIDYLNNAISFTTVTVHFREPKVSLKALKDSKQGIQESMLAATIGAIQFLAKAIPATIAVVIWLAIILGTVTVLKNWIMRLFKRE